MKKLSLMLTNNAEAFFHKLTEMGFQLEKNGENTGVFLFSEDALGNHDFRKALNLAFEKGENICAIFLSEMTLSLGLKLALEKAEIIEAYRYPTEESLKTRLLSIPAFAEAYHKTETKKEIKKEEKPKQHGLLPTQKAPEHLFYLFAPASGKLHRLHSMLVSIGRSEDSCDLVFPDDLRLSRHHADIVYYKDAYYLIDAGSTHGSYVCGKKLGKKERAPLQAFDEIRLSEQQFIFLPNRFMEEIKGKTAVLFEPESGEIRFLDENYFFLGREYPWEKLVLPDEIGRKHARISFSTQHEFCDMGSVNGSYINGKKAPEGKNIPLFHGDVIRLHNKEFVYLLLR